MQYRLSTLLVAFVVVWSSLAVFGMGGLVAAAILLVIAALYRSPEFRRHALFLLRAMRKPAPLVVIALCGLCLVGLLLPATSAVREAPRRVTCTYNLKQIGLALHNYGSFHGGFPPTLLADQRGRPTHSWRTLILPYLEYYGPLHDKYSLGEPWDGPNNSQLAAEVPLVYHCPTDPSVQGRPVTSYVAVTGPGTAWGNPPPFTWKPRVIVVEVANSNVNWMEPHDFTLDEACRAVGGGSGPGISGHGIPSSEFFFHDEVVGTHILFSDATVAFVPAGLPPETIKSVLTGDKKVEEAWKGFQPVRRRRIHWTNCAALAVLIVSYAVLLFRPREKRPPAGAPASPSPPAASGGNGSGE